MNRIRLLPEQVANQIAAGEVIERPASVVKELVENSLDAQATRVTVEIQTGGRSLIRVTDDGVGMSRDDALLCLERHATSKIRRAEDLAAIGSMGFRGEALPSIASVSRFTLTTRERETESPEGTRVVVSGGKMVEVKVAGAAPGTSIEVRQLFFNLPARRKFLRTEETESAHIQHYLTLAALSFPEVAFQFHKDGRLVWQLPALTTRSDASARLSAVRERLRALCGGEQKLLPVDYQSEFPAAQHREGDSPGGFDALEASPAESSPAPQVPGFRVWGFMGAPGVSRATREDQHLFVNRRPVENRGLNYALLEGYHTALMKGRYPVCCLFLELDPAAVDVNVHPAKREVKFHREPEVRRLMAQAIREALLAFHGQESGQKAGPGQARTERPLASAPKTETGGAGLAQEQNVLPNFPGALRPAGTTPAGQSPEQRPLRMGFGPGPAVSPEVPAAEKTALSGRPPASIDHTPTEDRVLTGLQSQAASVPAQPPTQAIVPLLNVPLRLIGVLGNLYVVLESDRGLVLLDQHAAHERILFEQMLNRLEHHQQAPSQKLLLPETVELSARDANFVREQLSVLTRLGVGLSEFGERTFLLDALPPFVKAADPRRFVIELVDELKATGREVNSLRLGEHTVAKTVCRHAVKAHDPLSSAELQNLVEDLRRCAMPYTCPHGRPTLIEMNFRELERKFGRSQ
jgi:DNA mismatch repair protein MutL